MSQECRQSCSKPEKLLATLNWPWNKTVIASQIFQYQHHHIPLSLQPFSWLTHHRWKQKDYRQIMVTDKNWLRYAQFPCWCVYPASMDMRPRSDQSSHPGWEVQVGCLLSAVICGADCFIMKCSSIKAWPWGQGWGTTQWFMIIQRAEHRERSQYHPHADEDMMEQTWNHQEFWVPWRSEKEKDCMSICMRSNLKHWCHFYRTRDELRNVVMWLWIGIRKFFRVEHSKFCTVG